MIKIRTIVPNRYRFKTLNFQVSGKEIGQVSHFSLDKQPEKGTYENDKNDADFCHFIEAVGFAVINQKRLLSFKIIQIIHVISTIIGNCLVCQEGFDLFALRSKER